VLARCPECGTRFRVRQEQLQAAGGRLRCGRCDHVFAAPDPPRDPLLADIPPLPAAAPCPSRAGPLWVVGSLLLALGLGLQAVWWERASLAANPDGLRLVQLLCHYADCRVQPPRATDRIEVLERSLAPRAGHPGTLHFHLRMVNRAPHAQPYPVIDLSLSDRIDRLVGVRRIRPRDYLPHLRPSDVMGRGTLVDVDVDLADPGAQVIGYEIDFN
jgi:predicted Zn finger-like uncharacterized protein